VYAGVDFAAVTLPAAIQKEMSNIQAYIEHRAKGATFVPQSKKNMHITLKELTVLNNKQRNSLKPALVKVAHKFKPFNIKNAVNKGKLKISAKDGLTTLTLAPDQLLTKLAFSIQAAANALVKAKKIPPISKRIDFPLHGHITLGYLIKSPKTSTQEYKKLIKKLTSNFKNAANTKFIVDKFSLLQSNAPKLPRVYYNKGFFHF